ncbi:uncharacterized protein [Solanum tuberosum]|uniref:uncharacterized protein n=1 Tax=Solanum tuberosum TaxID=4113 RepID=UPI00073A4884|nr:PREDICTED: uncharacterized protein LOC107061733 [Solanum tuberosum]
MSANGENSCQVGHSRSGVFHRDDIDDANSIYNSSNMGKMGESGMPQADGKNLSQESIRFCLFPLSLTGRAIKWLVEHNNNSIKSWEELVMAFHERFFPPSRMMKQRDDIHNFKQKEGEPIHESWIRFKRCLRKCPTHGLPGELLLQYFYRSLESVNKGIADQLVLGGIMLQSFEVASFLLDGMTKVNQAWYTKDDQVSPLCFWLTQEQIKKERERDENIKKMLSQMEILQEHMNGTRGVFRVEEGSSSGYSRPGENQGWNSRRYEKGFHPRYQPLGGNKGWNYYSGKEPMRCWQDGDERDDQEEDHTHLSESPKSKGSAVVLGKVNSHVDAINMLEGKLSLLSAQLTSKTLMDYSERELAVVTRSGKVEIGNVMEDEDPQKHEEGQGVEEQDLPIRQNLTKEPQEKAEQKVQAPKIIHPLPKIPPPFPQRLKKKNENAKFKKFLSVFKSLSINLPLVEALLGMSGYAKLRKELVTKKRSLDYETIEVPHSCSAIMTNDSITK